jgi:hypothetical protein
MTKDEALDLALEALESWAKGFPDLVGDLDKQAITAIKQARAAFVQEPVAWMSREDYDDYLEESKVTSATVYNYQLDIPLYTTPPAQEPVAWRTYTGRGYYIIDSTFEEAQKNYPDREHQPLYTTPPNVATPLAAPAVPDVMTTAEGEHPEYVQGWNDCRQLMLQTRNNRHD